MKWISLRATTRSERFALVFYPFCLLFMLALRLSPHHRGEGWTFLVMPVLFFGLLLWKIQQRQLGPVEWPISLHLSSNQPDAPPTTRG